MRVENGEPGDLTSRARITCHQVEQRRAQLLKDPDERDRHTHGCLLCAEAIDGHPPSRSSLRAHRGRACYTSRVRGCVTLSRMEFRAGTPGDADAVAVLHTESWRSAYAGIMPDSYLDGPLLEERRELWAGRLTPEVAGLDGGSRLLIAERENELHGFVYL